MALRHTAEFTDFHSRDWKIEIHDENFGGVSSALTLGAAGFELTWDGATDTTHDTIVGSSVRIPLIFKDSTEDGLIAAMRDGMEGDFTVRIYRAATTSSAADQFYWAGVAVADGIITDEPYPQEYLIEATDDLGLLDEILYKASPTAEYADSVSVVVTLSRILSKLRTFDAWGAGDTLIKTLENFSHADHVSPYMENTIVPNVRLRNVDSHGDANFHTCREVLYNLCRNFGARIFLSHGAFWFVPITGAFATTSLALKNYLPDGSADASPTLTPGETVVVTNTTTLNYTRNPAAGDFVKLAGWEYSQLPPLSRVSLRHYYKALAYDWYGVAPGDTVTGFVGVKSYGLSTTVNTDEVVTVYMAYTATVDQNSTAFSTDRGRRLKLKFQLRHGAVYAKRTSGPAMDGSSVILQNHTVSSGVTNQMFQIFDEPEDYTTATTEYIEIFTDVYDRNHANIVLQGSIALTFPPFSGTTGATQVGFISAEVWDNSGVHNSGEDSSVNTFGFPVIYQLHGSAVIDGDYITWFRDNDDEKAREELELDDVILGDQLSTISPAINGFWLINDGGWIVSSPAWSSDLEVGIETSVHDLAALDIMRSRKLPTEIVRGAVQAEELFFHYQMLSLAESAGRKYLLMRLTQFANDGIFEVEAFERRYTTTGSATATNDGSSLFSTAGDQLVGRRGDIANGLGIASTTTNSISQLSKSFASSLEDLTAGLTAGRVSYNSIDALLDVDTTTRVPAVGDLLEWDGSNWITAAPAGGSPLSTSDQQIADDVVRTIDVSAAISSNTKLLVTAGATTIAEFSSTISNVLTSAIFRALTFEVNSALVLNGHTSSQSGQVSIREAGSNGVNFVAWNAPAAIASSFILTLPDAPPTVAGQVMDFTTAGVGSFVTPSAGGSDDVFVVLTGTYYHSGGGKHYVPMGGDTTREPTSLSSAYPQHSHYCPFDGEVVRVTLASTGAASGATDVSVHKNNSTTAVETQTGTIGGYTMPIALDFSSSQFSKLDRLHIGVDPTSSGQYYNWVVVLKYDKTT